MDKIVNKIKEDIKQSGYLTELKTGQIMKSNNWIISFGRSYHDFDEDKSREIDIIAYKIYNNLNIKFQLVINLYVEVKKEPTHPWIVFMTEEEQPCYGWTILHCGEGYHESNSIIFSYKDLNIRSLMRKDHKTGTSFHEAFKKTESPSKIYKSLIGASKAAYFFKKNWGEHPDNIKFDPKRYVVIEFMIPIVVVEGQLFEVHLIEDDLDVHPSTWLPLKLNYSSPNYVKEYRDLTFRPFVSTIGGLQALLEIIENWGKRAFKKFQKTVELNRLSKTAEK